ncbi:MAG: M20/M25/M40 family metallo-hydrolase [Spirochaetales bacterium]|nr:M20/M25/M40 family metallo-hydrolase [Spirochaetales bacterium]
MKNKNIKIVDLVKEEIGELPFTKAIESLLMEILNIDTSPEQEIKQLGKAEALVFGKLSEYLKGLVNLDGMLIKHPVAANIEGHEFYTKVFPYPGTKEIPADYVYNNRYNLLYLVESKSDKKGRNVGLNAHIDVVTPYFPPEKDSLYIRGRGSTDDKGGVMVIIGALAILDSLVKKGRVELMSSISAMFVIDEELGGNGSLSVAMDHDLQRNYYDSLLVLECAGNRVYAGNRGAVFIKVEGILKQKSDEQTQSILLESIAFGIVSIVMEGLRIKKESRHSLFPQNPVYTCTGILGPFGKHASGICDNIVFLLAGLESADVLVVMEAIKWGLSKYIRFFGDKKNMLDSLTGSPKIVMHYTFDKKENKRYQVCIHGSGGHMGSLPENDAAITKWAFIVKELTELKLRLSIDFSIYFPGKQTIESIIFEGAQSFLPCHKMEDVCNRIEKAFIQGVGEYDSRLNRKKPSINWSISFDKLHNEAFVTDPESESVRNVVTSALEAGISTREQVLEGWDASCDARIFALEYPGIPVITTGPGELNSAHSDKEALFLPDFYNSILFTVLYILKETNSKVP